MILAHLFIGPLILVITLIFANIHLKKSMIFMDIVHQDP